ncbi:purine-nucleoside phosphorylase [Stratiformator vulcanicus]|uniref:Purine nucleoside phosphorylase n=1 Tax=Stratiformator vulcanicus TaxID=2527980 RepID=A0A517R0W4_9PLAN|nr:purine-nucleoside phosphorylase [Stratiformator vulcanicus]QDT37542.1 Purine nucleoside phosphorylase 1 [Stratiformator vulcanicus]
MDGLRQQIEEAVGFLRKSYSETPRIGMILGTGLGDLAEQIETVAEVPYADIPHFPTSTVESHRGQLACGTLGGVPVVAMEGRFHYYEGYSLSEVTFPVRVMQALGAEILIVTNAAGGMNPLYELADIVLVEDHINLMPDNPLRGVNDDSLGPRFPDMSEPYDYELLSKAVTTARRTGTPFQKGVFVAVPGPNLETRAEYRMLRNMGADLVGMSTVPEVIVAAHAGMKVLTCSVITDICLPDALEPVAIEKILEVAAEGGQRLSHLLAELIPTL